MTCCDHDCHAPNTDTRYRQILWVALGEGKQEQVEDDLRNADEHILRWMNALACCHLKNKVGEKEKAQEEEGVFE